jgi:hypothetical protein
MTAVTVIGVVGLAAAGLLLLGCFRRNQVWQEVALGELGRARIPEDLRLRPQEEKATQDYVAFEFQRIHDTHINGQTSLAEEMQITLFAEDLEWERIERGTYHFGFATITRRPKDDVVEETTDGPLRWKITREVYERHPVTEPSWRVLLLHREKRVLLEWRGFRKQYDLEAAKRNARQMMDSVTVSGDRKAYFAIRRDWPADTWEQNYVENVAALRVVFGNLAEGQWRSDGPWRFAIDRERPRRFLLMRRLGMTEKPDGPMDFRGPVTRFSFAKDYLRQDNQGSDGGLLGQDMLEGIRAELTDPASVYYYSIQTLNLWKRHESIDAEVAEMRRKFDELLKKYEAGRLVGPSPRR